MLNNKIDFIVTVTVNNANPNGDPLAGNMPRTDSKGFGEISDVCIKRKIRNRMQDQGYSIFVQSRDRIDDEKNSLEERYTDAIGAKVTDEAAEKEANEKWLDVRSFGQVITYNSKSIGIRGPVSIGIAKSLDPIEITSMQITRSTNGMKPKGDKTRSSDTMGTKHFVEFGTYIIYGAVNCFYAEKTGFSKKDLAVIKESLRTLFINDSSSARPEGSMEVKDIYWFTHSSKIGDVSSAKIKSLISYNSDNSMKSTYEDYAMGLNEEKLNEYKQLGLQVEHFAGI
ncbi:type I-C CRISPR-associated protein Cas7/Csd2 [Macrococcus carouselicus]|uniref:Type I-C CRISPR-associated protein Cas7/Csd2 n=1 Tax=Macrococcus carouselicus TaxID=69969 RepID=A0A9Q8FRE9_9STAP|nr:type I-C CRISPR-associated protein Cas7/Csd2 [Macrococcus carouselicus]TDM04009.1 type I-C CRISPR-associated protein Cas7/Csd2 [Macrococcus carouselicus]